MPAEFEGKNVAQAVDSACQALGIDKSRLIYEVVCQGSSGIFGLVGTRKARIRVVGPDQSSDATVVLPLATTNDIAVPAAAKDDAPPPTDGSGASAQRAVEAREAGIQALQRLVDAITEGAQVTAHNHDEALHFSISGGNRGLLIGRHGQTLEAIQYLADKIVNRGNAARVRIHVDVEGYQEKRGEQLKDRALKLASKARRSGKPQRLEPMNAYDRRIVHMALKNDAQVRTQSVGDGGERALVIYPRLAAAGKTPSRPGAAEDGSGGDHTRPQRRRAGKQRSG